MRYLQVQLLGFISTTSPSIQPKPSCSPCSKPFLARSCIPTHTPRNGLPLCCTCSSNVSRIPAIALIPAAQSANAPTPGRIIRSALATSSGFWLPLWLFLTSVRHVHRICHRAQIARTIIDNYRCHAGITSGTACTRCVYLSKKRCCASMSSLPLTTPTKL